ncbi:FAD-dependent hydroxylase [Spirulina sp. 06S082]|uniref:FAD-dependent hydroxylase n=1 Tax=Spirulina sp. 06S082 TaxID=3110248 RepID=UPI002B21999E|nr:FAD-dependent hydroxylase [Spirulina sp. 06S082]MEA5469659.1 FAD-dependent hydroxylase [Spirulina sp. 06S082]
MTKKQIYDIGVNRAVDCDLIIVGGGIVGATFACALKDSGLRVIIIEAQTPEKAAARQRAYNLSLLSGRIFEGIGVWGQILPQIAQYRNIRLSDGEYPSAVEFVPADLGTEVLGYVAGHGVILSALQRFLKTCPGIQWLCPAEVIDICWEDTEVTVEVQVEGKMRQLRSPLIVGADGAKSQVRSRSRISTRGWKYWQSCLTFEIQHQHPHNDTAFERFWNTGPMGVLPLPGNRCQIVLTAPHATAKALKDLDEVSFQQELERRMGGVLGKVEAIGDRFIFPVQLMQSENYTRSRLALIGDAAHCCHPVGGQGLNLGLRDAAALAQVLQEAHKLGEDIGSLPVLRRYEKWRKGENLTILGFTDFLDRMFSNQWLPLILLRRLGLWMLRYIQPLKVFALQLMTGLKGRTPELAKN